MSIKNIYLGQVSSEMLEAFGDEGYFDFADEKWSLRLAVDLESGMTQIYDSVGRMVPVDKDTYMQLAAAFSIIVNGQSDYDEIVETVKDAQEDLDACLDDLVDFGVGDGYLVV